MDDGRNRDWHERVTRATIPAEWVQTISGFSAHAAQHGLLEFARDVTLHTIVLVHGPEYAQDALARHFANTVESAEQIGRARRLTPTVLSREIELDTAKLTPETVEGTSADLRDLVDSLHEQVGALNEELAAVRNETGLSEGEIRDIVRDELAHALGTEEDD